MTITYSLESSTSGLATFVKLLIRWKGSIYKLMWKEVVIFLSCYFTISFVYRWGLDVDQRGQFERLALFIDQYTNYIPLTFLLGFFVSLVVGRWWSVFSNLAWPDNCMILLAAALPENDEETRIIRRTLARLLNLTSLLVLRDISTPVRKRFPTMEHVVIAGFMTEDELKLYEGLNCPHHKFFVPFQWAITKLRDVQKQGKIDSDRLFLMVQKEFIRYKVAIATVFCYDWISVPLSYTQVVTIAVHGFFLACLFGRQYLSPNVLPNALLKPGEKVDLYFPFFTFLQFMFYMGWLKVAESLINPLGEDDDDFDVNYMIDRNLQVSYLIVDRNNENEASFVKDAHWDEDLAEIPYTTASKGLKNEARVGSATAVQVPFDETEQFLLSEEPNSTKYRSRSPTSYLSNRRDTDVVSYDPEFRGVSNHASPLLKTKQFLMQKFLATFPHDEAGQDTQMSSPKYTHGHNTPSNRSSQVDVGQVLSASILNELQIPNESPGQFGKLIREKQLRRLISQTTTSSSPVSVSFFRGNRLRRNSSQATEHGAQTGRSSFISTTSASPAIKGIHKPSVIPESKEPEDSVSVSSQTENNLAMLIPDEPVFRLDPILEAKKEEIEATCTPE